MVERKRMSRKIRPFDLMMAGTTGMRRNTTWHCGPANPMTADQTTPEAPDREKY